MNQFIKSVIEVSHVEFSSYDLRTGELICSSGLARKVLGYTEEQYSKISSHFSESIIHPADREKVLEHIRLMQSSTDDDITETTARYRKANGDYIWVYTRRIVSQRDLERRPTIITSISEDISELMKLQEELEKSLEALNKIAFKNSHEVRSPVATIIGLINLMSEHSFTSDFNEQCFQLLKKTVQKLDDIIFEINEISQIKKKEE